MHLSLARTVYPGGCWLPISNQSPDHVLDCQWKWHSHSDQLWLWWPKGSTKFSFVLACKDQERSDYLCFLEISEWWSSKCNLLLRLLFNSRANGKGLAPLKLQPRPAVKMTHPRSELRPTRTHTRKVTAGKPRSYLPSKEIFSLSVHL